MDETPVVWAVPPVTAFNGLATGAVHVYNVPEGRIVPGSDAPGVTTNVSLLQISAV